MSEGNLIIAHMKLRTALKAVEKAIAILPLVDFVSMKGNLLEVHDSLSQITDELYGRITNTG